jgi:hypothetical protein
VFIQKREYGLDKGLFLEFMLDVPKLRVRFEVKPQRYCLFFSRTLPGSGEDIPDNPKPRLALRSSGLIFYLLLFSFNSF